ncbi:MAG: hypothetical protein IPJ65_31635 [Archangiaceae bacterium]|nr:hypothetical protein [Archangiaceae bacterium]
MRPLVLAALALSACPGPRSIVDIEPPPMKQPQPPRREPVVPPTECATSTPAAWGRVADGVRDVTASVCGDLFYRGADGLHLRRADGTDAVVETSRYARGRFDLTGRYALHSGEASVTLEDLVDGTRRTEPATALGVEGFGYDEAAKKSLAYLIDARGVVVLSTASAQTIAGSTRAGSLYTAPFGTTLALLSENAAHLADLKTLTTRTLALPATELADFARLTPDGNSLVYQHGENRRCGDDSFCNVAVEHARVFRTDTGEVEWELPETIDLQKTGYDRSGLYWSETGHVLAVAGIFVTSNRPGTWVLDTAAHHLSWLDQTLYSFLDNGEALVFELAGSDYSVFSVDPADPDTRTRTLIDHAAREPGGVPHFIVSPDGSALAYQRWVRAVRNDSGSTVANVNEIVVRSAGGERVVAQSESFFPQGIGPCGDLLFSGWRFADGGPPQTAPQSETAWFQPDGYAWAACSGASVAVPDVKQVNKAVELSSELLALSVSRTGGAALLLLTRSNGELRELFGSTRHTLIAPARPSGFVTALQDDTGTLFHGRP